MISTRAFMLSAFQTCMLTCDGPVVQGKLELSVLHQTPPCLTLLQWLGSILGATSQKHQHSKLD
jgi:hypothetical protein